MKNQEVGMQSSAKSVDSYLEEIPMDRKHALGKLRALCLEHLSDFEESMYYGLPGYKRNGKVEVGFASQKHFLALYILKTDVMDKYHKALKVKAVSLGKGCIRYANPDKIDFKIVELILKSVHASTDDAC
jgi:uncharacterized protein YdhG (YjbR/CyaY superfamily)